MAIFGIYVRFLGMQLKEKVPACNMNDRAWKTRKFRFWERLLDGRCHFCISLGFGGRLHKVGNWKATFLIRGAFHYPSGWDCSRGAVNKCSQHTTICDNMNISKGSVLQQGREGFLGIFTGSNWRRGFRKNKKTGKSCTLLMENGPCMKVFQSMYFLLKMKDFSPRCVFF